MSKLADFMARNPMLGKIGAGAAGAAAGGGLASLLARGKEDPEEELEQELEGGDHETEGHGEEAEGGAEALPEYLAFLDEIKKQKPGSRHAVLKGNQALVLADD